MNNTADYYDYNCDDFFERTVNVDMSGIYNIFEAYISPGDSILDLGCGVGRDSKYFVDKGYSVIAIDPSEKMCNIARTYAGVNVVQQRAEELSLGNMFDAIWACASLLHVSKNDMKNTLMRVLRVLKVDGVMYASWKHGNTERFEDGRFFNDYTPNLIVDQFKQIPGIDIIKVWITKGVQDSDTIWTNIIIRKTTK